MACRRDGGLASVAPLSKAELNRRFWGRREWAGERGLFHWRSSGYLRPLALLLSHRRAWGRRFRLRAGESRRHGASKRLHCGRIRGSRGDPGQRARRGGLNRGWRFAGLCRSGLRRCFRTKGGLRLCGLPHVGNNGPPVPRVKRSAIEHQRKCADAKRHRPDARPCVIDVQQRDHGCPSLAIWHPDQRWGMMAGSEGPCFRPVRRWPSATNERLYEVGPFQAYFVLCFVRADASLDQRPTLVAGWRL
jgi:hypothetical protein